MQSKLTNKLNIFVFIFEFRTFRPIRDFNSTISDFNSTISLRLREIFCFSLLITSDWLLFTSDWLCKLIWIEVKIELNRRWNSLRNSFRKALISSSSTRNILNARSSLFGHEWAKERILWRKSLTRKIYGVEFAENKLFKKKQQNFCSIPFPFLRRSILAIPFGAFFLHLAKAVSTQNHIRSAAKYDGAKEKK